MTQIRAARAKRRNRSRFRLFARRRRQAGKSDLLSREVSHEVLELLLLAMLDGLQLLDASLILLDLGLILAQAGEVALVQLAVGGRLAQVGPQPRLVLRQRVQLP